MRPIATDEPEPDIEGAKRFLRESFQGLNPAAFDDPSQVQEAVKGWHRRLRDYRVNMSRFNQADQAEIAAELERAAQRFDEHRIKNGRDDVVGSDVRGVAYGALGLGKVKKIPRPNWETQDQLALASARDRASAYMEGGKTALEAAGVVQGLRAGGSNGSNGHYSLDEQQKAQRQERIRAFAAWGMSGNTATKLVDLGLDPKKLPRVVDARRYGLKAPTIARLVERGIQVVNVPGVGYDTAGYTKRELLRGETGSVDTPEAQARFDRQRGLLLRRTTYARDAQGNAVAVHLDPRYTAGGLLGWVRNHTVGAVRRGVDAKRRKADEAKLRDPYHRVRRIEEYERHERLTEIEGRLRDTHGVRRAWTRLRLMNFKWSMIHKGWLAFFVLISLIFIPIGIFPYGAWGLGGLVLVALKYASFALVNVYNLLAASFVGLLNLVGNSVVGGFEWASRGVLDYYDLGTHVCTGSGTGRTCDSRLFSYTVARVDTTFPGFPTMPKPPPFDKRTLLEFILQVLGLRFDLFNQLRRLVRGG